MSLDPGSAVLCLAVAALLDLTFREPPAALHPVVLVGRLTKTFKRLAPRRGGPACLAGAAYTATACFGVPLS